MTNKIVNWSMLCKFE